MLGALAALAVPLAVAATAFACVIIPIIIISAAPQSVEWGDGTARFKAQITVRGEDQVGGGIVLILLHAGEEEKWFLRAEEGSAEVDPTTGEVTEAEVAGTALDDDGRPHGAFRARVTPTSADGSTDSPDCLTFDIDGANAALSERVVVEGTMRVLGDRADDDEPAR